MYQPQVEFEEILARTDVAPKMIGDTTFLAAVSPGMADEFCAWLAKDEVARGIGHADEMLDADAEAAIIEDMTSRPDERHFAIYDKDDARLIGECSLVSIDPLHRSAKLCIWIGRDGYRGRGRGRDAVSMLLGFGFQALNLHSISLEVYSFNAAAIECYKSVGFKECGRLHEAFWMDGKYWDIILMELLDKKWRRSNPAA